MSRRIRSLAPLWFVGAILFAPRLHAQSTWYVDDDAAAGGDGTSWASAFATLQDAVRSAVAGDAIVIAGGTYLPDHGGGATLGDPRATFQLDPGLTLRGGFRGLASGGSPDDRDPVAFATVLSGDLAADDPNLADNSLHVVTLGSVGPAATLDGLAIGHGATEVNGLGAAILDQGGGVTATGCSFDDNFGWNGAAIGSTGGTVELTDCALRRNLCVLQGGALHQQGGVLRLTRCTVSDNIATGSSLEGGGVWSDHADLSLIDCDFERNIADHGGALAMNQGTLVATGSRFAAQITQSSGGALWISRADVVIDDCEFEGNDDARGGGGIYAWRKSTVNVSRSRFVDNRAGVLAAVWADLPATVSLHDCVFDGNFAFGTGGAAGGNLTDVVRCTFQGNSALYDSALVVGPAAGRTTQVIDCVFRDNVSTQATVYVEFSPGTARIERCTLAGNSAGNGLCGGVEINAAVTQPVVIAGCILWNNSAGSGTDEAAQLSGPPGVPVVDWCCIEGWTGGLGGTGNHGSDPLFVDPSAGDVSLQPGSPALEAGDPAFFAPSGFRRDLSGNGRQLDGLLVGSARVDQGALEFSHVRLGLTGDPTPGGTATLVTSGTSGLPVVMLIALAPAELLMRHFGTLFLDLTTPCLCVPWTSAPSAVDVQIPVDAPLGPVFLQEFATTGRAGNLSDAIVFDIE